MKRLDTQLSPPPVQVLLSAGGELPWQDVQYTASWLRVWPDEIYGSTETGVIARRYREQEQRRWLPFPGVQFRAEGEAFRLFSPLIAEDNGLLLDDLLQFSRDGQFHLMGRRGRIVKIEENVFHSGSRTTSAGAGRYSRGGGSSRYARRTSEYWRFAGAG